MKNQLAQWLNKLAKRKIAKWRAIQGVFSWRTAKVDR